MDDFSDKEHLGKQLDEYAAQFKGKLKVVRAKKREGLIRARLLGFEVASGPVVTYLDSHCEVREQSEDRSIGRDIKTLSHGTV